MSPPDLEAMPRSQSIDGAFVVNILNALHRIDAAAAERAVDIMLGCEALYPVDRVLIPAVLAYQGVPGAAKRLARCCLDQLQGRIQAPLLPPADWTREGAIGCSCAYCAELSRFLVDPRRATWLLKAAERNRRHVQDMVGAAKVDLDLRTEKLGSPLTLVATKNLASHERRVRQRQLDATHADRIAAWLAHCSGS